MILCYSRLFQLITEKLTSEDDSEDKEMKNKSPILFNQKRLGDFIRDLGLDKIRAELAASRLKDYNLLEEATKITEYCHR